MHCIGIVSKPLKTEMPLVSQLWLIQPFGWLPLELFKLGQYHGCWCPGSLSPGHQQSWHWQYHICYSLSLSRKDLNSLCHLNVEKSIHTVYMFSEHDDVTKWKHFPRYWPFVWGIHQSPVNSPHKGQWHGAWMFILICARINGWVNNCDAGDLRRHQAHYDIIVMN